MSVRGLKDWQPKIGEEDCAAAAERALVIAERLKNPVLIEQAIANSRSQSRYFFWNDYGFASGLAGLALLWAHLDRCYPDSGWDNLAHRSLSKALKDLESTRYASPSLFGGLAGIGFSAQYAAAREAARYSGLLKKIDNYINVLVAPSIAFFRRPEPVFGVPVQLFDLISGLSGVTIYFLSRYGSSHEVDEAVRSLLGCFVQLATERNGIPAWHTPKALLNQHDTMTELFPDGHLNCGLAHGIPGPLGAMAVAKLSGVHIPGVEEAIECLASWLLHHRNDDSWGMNWPMGVPLVPKGDRIKVASPLDARPSHAGWCYGSPGITRSIFLSGLALKRSDLCEAALRSIEAVVRRPEEVRTLYSPTFCHGVAGLLQIVLRFFNDAPSESLASEFRHLFSVLMKYYDPSSPLGYQSKSPEGEGVDSPALLDGAAGIALALLSVRRDIEPAWDRAFLLS